MSLFKMYLLCLILSVAFLYGLRFKAGSKILLPGDINIEKQGAKVYIPLSSALIIATILFIILRSLFS